MEELAAWCAKLGVAVPPVPEVLRPLLQRQSEHTYATLKPPLSMYDALHWGFSERLPDFVAVGHAGHGVNSYLLSYALGLGPLRLVVQVGYGGAYMALADSQEAATAAFAEVARVLEAWERAGRPRLRVSASDFYGAEWTLDGVRHESSRTLECLEEVSRALTP